MGWVIAWPQLNEMEKESRKRAERGWSRGEFAAPLDVLRQSVNAIEFVAPG